MVTAKSDSKKHNKSHHSSMRIVNKDIKVAGSSVYVKKTDPAYNYVAKFIYGVNLPDLVKLLGAEGAARLIKFYGGCNMYIPTIKTIQKRIRNCIIRLEHDQLLAEGVYTRKQVVEHLSKKFSLCSCSIDHITTSKSNYPNRMRDNKKHQEVTKLLDQALTDTVAENMEIFKRYGIL